MMMGPSALFVVAAFTFVSALPAGRTAVADEFNVNTAPERCVAGPGYSCPTGTQGVVGNPNCPPPVLPGGITPKNWSCKTGRQARDAADAFSGRGTPDRASGRPAAPLLPEKPAATAAGGPPPLLRGYVSNTEELCLAPPPAQDIRQEVMDLAEEMDRLATRTQNGALAASNRFFQKMAEAVAGQLEFLAQPAGEPARQVGAAVVAYLTNDRNENHKQLLDGAVKAVEDAQRDPAGTLGAAAGSALLDVATGTAASGVRLCTAGASKTIARAKAVAQARKAARELRDINRDAERSVGAFPDGLCPAGERFAPANPFNEQNNCFPATVAHDQRIETGKPYTDSDFRPLTFRDARTPMAEVRARLKEVYGERVIDGLPPFGQRRQAEGLPFATGRRQFENELRQAGPGSRAIVMFHGPGGHHVVHAHNVPGRGIEYFDPQKGIDAGFMIENVRFVEVYRTR
jgi:hypothetical protein